MEGAFTVAVEGAVLSGEQHGEATLLVFVHGMAGDRHEWDRLVAALPAPLAPLTYDLRGFGRSEADEGVAYSHADDLLTLLDARGIERATLVGLSMGGAIALNFALSHPERVARLVLISPWLTGWEASDDWTARWREVAAAARAGDMARARQLWLRHPMFDTAREMPDLAAELRRSLESYPGRQWIRDPQRAELPDIDRLCTLAAPTLLLTGARDHPDLRLIADVIEATAAGRAADRLCRYRAHGTSGADGGGGSGDRGVCERRVRMATWGEGMLAARTRGRLPTGRSALISGRHPLAGQIPEVAGGPAGHNQRDGEGDGPRF